MNCAVFDPKGAPGSTNTVRVWLLLGKYPGDNAQVLGLGDHLAATFGWHCETRLVRFHRADAVPRLKLPAAIDFARSDSLDPPFPDVLVSCGRYYGAVAAWLKGKAERPPVHVHFGRIAAPMADFDLIGAAPQYGLPEAPNAMPLTLPIVRRNPAWADASLAAWRPVLAGLPKPMTGVLVGGFDAQMRFGPDEARALAEAACTTARGEAGSLAIAFIRRTPDSVRRIVRERVAAAAIPHFISDWPAPDPNPYPALLAMADRFLVTSDSASLIADACLTGRAVELFRLPVSDFVSRFSSRGLGLSIDARRRRRARAGLPADLFDRLRDLMVARYWMRPWDEIRDFLVALDRAGLVDGGAVEHGRAIQARELRAFGARIAALVAARMHGLEAEQPALASPVLIAD